MISESVNQVGEHEYLQKVRHIAIEAGKLTLKYFQKEKGVVQYKQDTSPLTQADLEANQYIMDALTALDPSIPIISEEAQLPDYEVRKSWPRFWLVDPLDGTKEFLRGNDEFTVNIALIENGEPLLGLIYIPARRTLYYAAKGYGAWKQEGDTDSFRIFSSTPDPKKGFVVVDSKSHPSPELETFLNDFPIRERIQAGSSLKFCLVAEGKADIYPRMNPTMEWDVAAGDCIFRNSAPSGQRISSLTYNKPDLRNERFVIGLDPSRPDTDITWHPQTINREQREALNGHKGCVVWLTGLSACGKSTVSNLVEHKLLQRGVRSYLLDGDNMRHGLNASPGILKKDHSESFADRFGLGFSAEDREENIRRIGAVARLFCDAGVVVLAAFISPYRRDRDSIRASLKKGDFMEVFVNASIDVCEKRDPKGLYKKVRAGELRNFTGIDDPYEPPLNPEVVLDAGKKDPDTLANEVIARLEQTGVIAAPRWT